MTPSAPRLQPVAARQPPVSRSTSTRSSASSLSSPSLSHSPTASPASVPSPSSPSAESTINSIIFRQPSIRGLEEERRTFPRGLKILEPRPIVYWSSVEERMAAMTPR